MARCRETINRFEMRRYMKTMVFVGVPAFWIALSPNDVKVAPAARDTLVALPNSFDPDMNNVLPAPTATEAVE